MKKWLVYGLGKVMSDFQPIETVPQDGTPVILRDLDGRTICAEIRRSGVTLSRTNDVPHIFDEAGELGSWLKWTRAG